MSSTNIRTSERLAARRRELVANLNRVGQADEGSHQEAVVQADEGSHQEQEAAVVEEEDDVLRDGDVVIEDPGEGDDDFDYEDRVNVERRWMEDLERRRRSEERLLKDEIRFTRERAMAALEDAGARVFPNRLIINIPLVSPCQR